MSTLNIANLDCLISHLEGLPEEKFDMQAFYSRDRGSSCASDLRGKVMHSCGTAACIAGWIFELDASVYVSVMSAGKWLGVSDIDACMLFEPFNYGSNASAYPLSRAIRTLKHMRSEYLRTGQVVVDWDAPEPAERLEWSAPVASERTLPAALTSLLGTPVYSEVL